MAKLTKEQLIESLKEMSLLEINDLIKGIEEEFGVSAAAPVAAAGAAPAAAEEPTEVSVVLTNAGASKIAIIKLYRELTGLGLMEAKAAVEKCPAVIKEDVKVEEAKQIQARFVEAGATVELK